MKDDFYRTKEWARARKLALTKAGYKCIRCSNAGNFVHHIIYLTEENYTDPIISLGLDNLEVLCQDCHNREHFIKPIGEGLAFDEEGNLIEIL